MLDAIQEVDVEELKERNRQQAILVRRLWAQNARLRRRCKILQGMVDWLRDQLGMPAKPHPKFEAADSLFKGLDRFSA